MGIIAKDDAEKLGRYQGNIMLVSGPGFSFIKLVNSHDLYFMPQPSGRKIGPAAVATHDDDFLDHFFTEDLQLYFIFMDIGAILREFRRCVLTIE